MVKRVLPADVRPDVEDMGVGQGGKAWAQSSLAELLQVGNFYAVRAKKPNEWNADFYISQCEQTLHLVKEDFEDAYKEKFKTGDKAVNGRFFEPRPSNCSMRYVFDDANPFGYNHGHHVVHIHFGLTPCAPGIKRSGVAKFYSLDADTEAAIYESFRH
jgi:hypothetical protein